MTVRNHHHDEKRPQQADTRPPVPHKKTFVEPAISSPVDVLEATTFFQVVDSGGTGLTKKDGE